MDIGKEGYDAPEFTVVSFEGEIGCIIQESGKSWTRYYDLDDPDQPVA